MLKAAASRVRDPVSGRSIWLAGMVSAAKVRPNGDLQCELMFESAHAPHDRKGMIAALEANLAAVGFTGRLHALHGGAVPERAAPASTPPPARKPDAVPGMTGPGMAPHGGPIQKKQLEGVRHVVAIASGKGGVGKSTVATNLAVALQRSGWSVGILDADIYGPSVPIMMNVHSRPMVDRDSEKILPVMSYGVRCLSMGMLVEPDEAMIWRGPMVMGAVRQFLQQARWDGLDVLLIDLPPGTGDAQLTLIQAVDLAGAVIVTTPQEVALGDAVRGITMFQKLDVPLLGLVENMAYYELPDGTRDPIFGEGGGARTASRFDTELLGQIPLRTAIRKSGDAGLPIALGDDASAVAFADVAARVRARLEAREA
jgi:ATP-binding protein involved in chromosome partitioning